MNRIHQTDPAAATGKAQQLFTAVQGKLGFVPNLNRVLGNWPAALERYLGLSGASPKRAPHEIRAWSAWLETMPVGEAEDLEWFAAQAKRINPARTDLQTIMDYLDADDLVSYGGAA